MSKATLARFTANYFDAGAIKFEAGKHYPLDDDTERHIAAGIAERIEVDIDAENAQRLAVEARLAADRAAAAAADAEALALAAVEAQKIADDAAAALAADTVVQTPAGGPVPPVPRGKTKATGAGK